MKKYLLPFVLILIFSCGKDDEPQGKALEFPAEFILSRLDYGTSELYEMNDMDFTKIDLSGSFIPFDQYNSNITDSEKELIALINAVELLDEEQARVTISDGTTGATQDTIINYQRVGDEIQLISDGITFFKAQFDENQESLSYCWFTYWATYTNSNGDWDSFPFSGSPCDSKDANELIPKIIDENSNGFRFDSIALNFSNFIYELK